MRMKFTIMTAVAVCALSITVASADGAAEGLRKAAEQAQRFNHAEVVTTMASAEQQLYIALENLKSLDGQVMPEHPQALKAALDNTVAASLILTTTMSKLEQAVRENTELLTQIAQTQAQRLEDEEKTKKNLKNFFKPYEPQTFTGGKDIDFAEFGRKLDRARNSKAKENKNQ